jgi:hypothetical protein
LTTFSRGSAAAFTAAAALSVRFRVPVSPGLIFFGVVARTADSAEPLMTTDQLEGALIEFAREADGSEASALVSMQRMTERAFEIASTETHAEVSLAHLIRAASETVSDRLERALRRAGCSLSAILNRVDGWSPAFLLSLQPSLGAENVNIYPGTVEEL